MKILQINTVYGTGSTGKITSLIEELIERNGHQAFVAYGRGKKPSKTNHYLIGNKIDFVCHVLFNFLRGSSGFASRLVTKRFLKWVDIIEPDIIHLHNIHGFYIHVGMLFEYIKNHNIKTVWTLHDCWSFTGQCAYFDYAECDKWKKQCTDCPIYKTDYPYSLFCDNSKNNYTNKKIVFQGVEGLIIVTPSDWLSKLVKQSFLQDYSVMVINNGIDLEVFNNSTVDTQDNASIYRCILAVANVWEKRKGLEFVLRLADDLPSELYKITVIGIDNKQKKKLEKKYSDKNIEFMCRTSNQNELAAFYRNAYVYVNPSLEENFPTTNLEALASGTPVITFASGGSSESITSDVGIVVERGNYDELKDAILRINVNEALRKRCRARAMLYDKKKCFDEYISIYESSK